MTIFQKTDQLPEEFSLDKVSQEMTLKKSVLVVVILYVEEFCLARK